MDSSSSTPRKEKKGLSRLWTKVKLAIRHKSKTQTATTTSKPLEQDNPPESNIQSSQQPQPISIQPELSTTPQTAPEMESTDQTHTQSVTADERDLQTKDIPAEMDTTPTYQAVIAVHDPPDEKAELSKRYERAQAIFKKYDLEFDEASWEMHVNPNAERVHKAPRMRVRWTCHECKTTFGHDKVCVECAHNRCRSCTRYPPKKNKARAAKKAAVAANLTEPFAPQEDVREGACHECQTAFDLGAQECSNCHHKICERCLQETIQSVGYGETHTINTS